MLTVRNGCYYIEELSVRKSTVTTEAGVSATKADVDVAVKTEPDNAEISSL